MVMADVARLIVTAVVSYAVLFVLAQLTGRKQISQLDFFDYISGISIGSIAAEMATELGTPWQELLAMVIYGVLTWLLTLVGVKSRRLRKLLNGAPVLLMDNGVIYREAMAHVRLDLSEFLAMCRQQGYFDLSGIAGAVMEYNGKLSILPTAQQRPVTTGDMHLTPEKARMYTEVILDGRVMSKNLKRLRLNDDWLAKQLCSQGYQGPEEVYLALCDTQQHLQCYRMHA